MESFKAVEKRSHSVAQAFLVPGCHLSAGTKFKAAFILATSVFLRQGLALVVSASLEFPFLFPHPQGLASQCQFRKPQQGLSS